MYFVSCPVGLFGVVIIFGRAVVNTNMYVLIYPARSLPQKQQFSGFAKHILL
jgi:hypothetical protein